MSFDVIVVGGGLAGSTLATRLAAAGRRVLVLEQETKFRDRVRGENMLPWGVDAARRLGVFDTLMGAGAHWAPRFVTYFDGQVTSDRDLTATTPHGQACLNLYHPDMQEALIALAGAAGADVRRGARVVALDAGPGRAPSVTFVHEGSESEAHAPVVVGADGRFSRMRTWGGFEVTRDPDVLTLCGTVLEDTPVPVGATHLAMGPGFGMLMAPFGDGRARTYFVYPGVAGRRGLTGAEKVPAFLEACRSTHVPSGWLANVRATGPLAEFEGAEHWVAHPVRDGVALVGDAAGASDPSWGCGLSNTLLDVEHLTNSLTTQADTHAALEDYAQAHDRTFLALHRILGWMTTLVWTAGPEADARRARVFPRMHAGEPGFPDNIGLGPFGPSDERARRLTLGEEEPATVA